MQKQTVKEISRHWLTDCISSWVMCLPHGRQSWFLITGHLRVTAGVGGAGPPQPSGPRAEVTMESPQSRRMLPGPRYSLAILPQPWAWSTARRLVGRSCNEGMLHSPLGSPNGNRPMPSLHPHQGLFRAPSHSEPGSSDSTTAAHPSWDAKGLCEHN